MSSNISLKEKLNTSMKVALKEGDRIRLDTVRLLLAEIKNKQIEKRTDDLEESEIIALLRKEIKKRKESLEYFEKAQRKDLIEKTKREIEVIESFLPPQLAEEEIRQIAESIIQKQENISFGEAMKAVMKELQDRAEGKKVAQIVRDILGERG
ncbi:GatB/YqeY domain-containing protein [Thermatribacter velox]|uniref:GatB/YqeY domain-containing protein n=1 Tax=Thermatribacter velox TaxID=3039681 RepID=A0ABZ2Y7U0_9BACT